MLSVEGVQQNVGVLAMLVFQEVLQLFGGFANTRLGLLNLHEGLRQRDEETVD